MHVEYLQYLVEVSNCKSISAAAKKLYLSQTSLSAIIASLERDLNITFFNRTHRGVTVTPEGKKALELIKEILEKNEELHNVYDSSSSLKRIVSVAVYPSVANTLSLYLMRQFAERQPDISLQIHELPHGQTFNAINEGVSNIAVAAENSSLIDIHHEMSKHKLVIEPLYEDRFYLAVSSSFRLADRDIVDISEISDERLAFTHVFPSFHDRTIAPVIRSFKLFAIFSNIETVKQAVADNDVIAIVPGLALLDDHRKDEGLIRQIPVSGFETGLTNYLLYKKPGMLSAAEKAALDYIKDFYRGLLASGGVT